MADKPYRVLFLGDRRIAWEVLKLLQEPAFDGGFDLCGLVSGPEIRAALNVSLGREIAFIPNTKRQEDAVLGLIAEQGVNLVVSVQHSWILSPRVLDGVDGHAFNLHNAKLPDYKGYNSISHAIDNGDQVFESTVHWMVDAVDCGDTAYTGHTEIRPDETARSLYIRTVPAAVGAFRRLLTDLVEGRTPPRKPNADGGVFYPRKSLEALADLTGVTDPAVMERRSRSVFFPPYTCAYRIRDGVKEPVIPLAFKDEEFSAFPPANLPQFG